MKKEKDIFREAVKRMKKEVLDAKFNEADKRNALKEAFTERPLEAGLAEEAEASKEASKTLKEFAPAVAGAAKQIANAGTAMVKGGGAPLGPPGVLRMKKPPVWSPKVIDIVTAAPTAAISAGAVLKKVAPALIPRLLASMPFLLGTPLGWGILIAGGLGTAYLLAKYGFPAPDPETGKLTPEGIKSILAPMMMKYDRTPEDIKKIFENADDAQLEAMFSSIAAAQARRLAKEEKKKDKKKVIKKKDKSFHAKGYADITAAIKKVPGMGDFVGGQKNVDALAKKLGLKAGKPSKGGDFWNYSTMLKAIMTKLTVDTGMKDIPSITGPSI